MNDPALRSVLDQVEAAVRDNRKNGAAAVAEQRCATPPMGCGQSIWSLATEFRDQNSRNEYEVTHLCQSCQDLIWVSSPDEIVTMAADTDNYGRCGVCGEYRPYEFVDVGIGVLRGFDCCRDDPDLPQCTKTPGCFLRVDHAHNCGPLTSSPPQR
jgi:hypothetical protein